MNEKQEQSSVKQERSSAYELADDAKNISNTIEALEFVQKAVPMLRQQADREAAYQARIAELEKLLEHSVGADCREMRYIQEIENKDARIAELEKACKELQEESDGYFLKVCELEKWEKRWSEKSQRQADSIAELEKEVNHMQSFYGCDPAYYGIKQSKPVAEVIEWEETYGHTFKKRTVSTVKWLENVEVGTKLYTHPVKQLTLDMIYKVSEKTPINNEDEWFDSFAKNLIKEISND